MLEKSGSPIYPRRIMRDKYPGLFELKEVVTLSVTRCMSMGTVWGVTRARVSMQAGEARSQTWPQTWTPGATREDVFFLGRREVSEVAPPRTPFRLPWDLHRTQTCFVVV